MTERGPLATLVEKTFNGLNKEIEELKKENAELKDRNTKLKDEVQSLRKQLNTAIDDWGKDLARTR